MYWESDCGENLQCNEHPQATELEHNNLQAPALLCLPPPATPQIIFLTCIVAYGKIWPMGLRLKDENLTPPQRKPLPLQIGCHASKHQIIGSYLDPRIRVCMVVCMYGGGYQAKLHGPSKVACEQLSIEGQNGECMKG
jgi:hypothetical protein